MPLKRLYNLSFFIIFIAPFVSAGQNSGAVISPMQLVVSPGDSVLFNCSLPTGNVRSIDWFVNGKRYNDEADDEEISIASDSNGSGSIRFKNLSKYRKAIIHCQTKDSSGQLSTSPLATFSVIESSVLKRQSRSAKSFGSGLGNTTETVVSIDLNSTSAPEFTFDSDFYFNVTPSSSIIPSPSPSPSPSSSAVADFSFGSGSGVGDTSGSGSNPDLDFDSGFGTPSVFKVFVISNNTAMSTSTTTRVPENNANRIYFSKRALMLIMAVLRYSLN